MIYFCTYFDSLYLDKGLVCEYTLHKQNANSILFILCFDDNVYKIVNNLKNTVPIKLKEIEERFPKLLTIKNTRLPKEYYATMSPILPLFIFEKYNYVDQLFYTDADMAFWSDPMEIKEIMNNYSLMVTDHGFEPPRENVRFNVGILGYKNDNYCKEFLNWWTDKCIEWCKWTTLSNGMCGDQGYLNVIYDEPTKFKNTFICPHPGINFGPWRLGIHNISENNNKKIVDNKYNLICYHYHEFKFINNNLYYPTGWKHKNSDIKIVYDPYFEIMLKIKK